MTQQMQELVEELRSTGYHGREAWLPKIERRKGTMIAAIRQLEVCASQMVSPWFDAAMDESELWSFLRSSFLPRLASLEDGRVPVLAAVRRDRFRPGMMVRLRVRDGASGTERVVQAALAGPPPGIRP